MHPSMHMGHYHLHISDCLLLSKLWQKTAISAVLGLAGAGLPTTASVAPAVASGAGYRKAQELARYE